MRCEMQCWMRSPQRGIDRGATHRCARRAWPGGNAGRLQRFQAAPRQFRQPLPGYRSSQLRVGPLHIDTLP